MFNPYFSLLRAVWHYGQAWQRKIIIYYVALILAQIFVSLSPYGFGRALDILQNFTKARMPELIFWLSFSIIVILLFWIFHGPGRLSERNIALKIQQAFRLKIYEELTRLPLKWHQDHHSGNIITRTNRASLALYKFAGEQFMYIQAIVKFIISTGFLLWISVPVGLLSLVASALVLSIVILFDRKLIPLYDAENEIDNSVGAVLFDYISNMTTVLTLRLGELTHSNLFKRLMSVWPFYSKEIVLNELKWFCMMILISVIQAITLISYILYTLDEVGTIKIGLVAMIFRYQWDLAQVFHELSTHYSELVHMDTDVKGIKTILDDIELLAHLPQGASKARQWHKLSIENLSFHHGDKLRHSQIFSHIDFEVNRGENIALIGVSGGGKSTLLNLLSGLYTPSQVRLSIDNRDFYDSLEPLQAIATLIPQDPEMFENTIAFNIAMDLASSDEDLMQAIRLSGFASVLETLPHGLNTDIREKGLNLSVGQKQRLALARGLFAARFSSLILMDEPTSSLDLPTENTILSGVIKAFPDSALIVSLHRLHLLDKFDKIIMLGQAKILAMGTTAELLHKPGPVRDLWLSYKK